MRQYSGERSPQTTTFAVPGATLDTELSDEGGQPVVQLHGLTSSRSRDRVLNLDLGRGLSGTRLLRYDARGHGRSTGRAVPEDYRWPVLADDLLRLLDAWIPGEQVHAVGPSMGTATLLHAAVREPGRFSGLTLVVPPTAWETRAQKSVQYRNDAAAIEAGGLSAFLAAAVHAPPSANLGVPETVPDVIESLLPSLFRGAALSDLPDEAEIAAITCPTTILAWTNDPSHPVSTAERLREVLPQSTLRVASTPSDLAQWPTLLYDDVSQP